ncbi:hypothetical protein M9H77_20731 [Catharanthus roseus]|uniref:Uncharacterized protein n=1 Tax=Catharanthus roseus TaxID=4058 RepID=A0ACC0AKD0_CATRO|nr:hypothetical protein M9H77_20731 [Catharanthus roseus]
MSLSLLQSYSSEEEEEGGEEAVRELRYDEDSDEDRNNGGSINRYKPLFDPNPASSSSLPSAFDAFSEISGPPQFLNNCVDEGKRDAADVQKGRHGGRKGRKDRKDLPAGAVVEAKAQLVGIHERVHSGGDGNTPQPSSSGSSHGVKRPSNPNTQDASELLRLCLKCGVPKTYSKTKGIVCPICEDRLPTNTEDETKKKGTVKDKEKLKRMKGQSSHATWKSETEMQLRQQFD